LSGQISKQDRARRPYPVAAIESATDHRPILIEEKDTRKRNPMVPRSQLHAPRRHLICDSVIEHAETFQLETAHVGQQVVCNPKLAGEASQRFHGVVADGNRIDVASLCRGALQLDQLRSAPGSPVGAAVDYHQALPASSLFMQVDRVPVLIGQNEVREPYPQRRTDQIEINLGQWNGWNEWHVVS
jgi:hypothetical protein